MRKRECDEGMLFHHLRVWRDPVARSGPENMAVDEWLMGQVAEGPILRFYDWSGDWVSMGYFQSLGEGERLFGDDVSYVRRWTGGGIVDHRVDVTYTLVIPKGSGAAQLRGGECYGKIHRAVASCLQSHGVSCELAGQDSSSESAACFEKPVRCDIVSGNQKLAGAGQRRTREGVLHQGSVIGNIDGLQTFLADQSTIWEPEELGELNLRYEEDEWLKRVL